MRSLNCFAKKSFPNFKQRQNFFFFFSPVKFNIQSEGQTTFQTKSFTEAHQDSSSMQVLTDKRHAKIEASWFQYNQIPQVVKTEEQLRVTLL